MTKTKATVEEKQQLIAVMQQENALLDTILAQQTVLHNCVTKRDWAGLEGAMANLQSLSDTFSELETKRCALCETCNPASESDVAPVLQEVRGKLLKSKVENTALNAYIRTTRRFLQGVFDSVVPQRRNKLYSRSGAIVNPEMSSIVLNQVI